MLSPEMNALLLKSLWETIYMVALSTVIATAAGIPLGVILVCTDRGGILQNLGINRVLGWIVNATRSTPFIILMVAIIPLTRMIVGTSIGTAAAMVPLCIAAAPFIARLVETSLKEVDGGVIEAALPTSELQATAAELLGVERTLFVPTNTMANLISGERRATFTCPPGHPSTLLPFVEGAVTTSVAL